MINQNHNFYCPHLILPEFLNDDIPREREKALIMGKQMMFKCDELWIFGEEISQGMLEEVAFSRNLNIAIQLISVANYDRYKKYQRYFLTHKYVKLLLNRQLFRTKVRYL
ncbi:MAG: DUF4406 domain-containing protein [Clostridia bacterium]